MSHFIDQTAWKKMICLHESVISMTFNVPDTFKHSQETSKNGLNKFNSNLSVRSQYTSCLYHLARTLLFVFSHLEAGYPDSCSDRGC